MTVRSHLLLGVMLWASVCLYSDEQPPVLLAHSAMAVEMTTGRVLFEKNPDLIIAPASLTKLVTLYCIYDDLKTGRVSRGDIVPISRNAWYRIQPYRSSLMFLEPGQSPTLLDIMLGLSVASGNDAAVAAAEFLSGSVEAFVKRMNETVSAMGFRSMHFDDPSGLQATNSVTAREFTAFCLEYLHSFPESISELHSVISFTYPRPENTAGMTDPTVSGLQFSNTNLLLGRVLEVTGLKTGYIDESGYNFAVTAEYPDLKVVFVLLGIPGENTGDGTLNRAIDAVRLATYLSCTYGTYELSHPEPEEVRIWYGVKERLKLSYERLQPVTIRRTDAVRLELKSIFFRQNVSAPIQTGEPLGIYTYACGDRIIASGGIFAAETVPEGNWFKRTSDAIRILIE